MYSVLPEVFVAMDYVRVCMWISKHTIVIAYIRTMRIVGKSVETIMVKRQNDYNLYALILIIFSLRRDKHFPDT